MVTRGRKAEILHQSSIELRTSIVELFVPSLSRNQRVQEEEDEDENEEQKKDEEMEIKMILPSLLIITLSILFCCNAAPATYDQRQDGKMNVRADLDNFFFVFVTKGSLFNDLSLLDFKSMARQLMVGQKNKIGEQNEPILSLTNENVSENVKTGKPYKVDIVRIPKNNHKSLQDLKELGRQDERLNNQKNEDLELTDQLNNSQSLSENSSGSASKKEVERTSSGQQDSANTVNKLQ
ncbi:hypothetical protein V1478_002605 [Vespula squamosa]|uniref:Uncharacterized protein n=1 Tax=Vespula squamosa TaxID=30214 RepID=A0ABD2BT23_VESSQ